MMDMLGGKIARGPARASIVGDFAHDVAPRIGAMDRPDRVGNAPARSVGRRTHGACACPTQTLHQRPGGKFWRGCPTGWRCCGAP